MNPRATLAFAVASIAALLTTAALAQARQGCGVNPDATSPELRRLISGTWYSENRAPQLGMVQRLQQTYLPTGVWEYQDETCGNVPGIPCSKNGGHGLWMATRQQDGSIYIRIQFSDIKRQNACSGSAVTFPNPGTMAGTNGQVARRIR